MRENGDIKLLVFGRTELPKAAAESVHPRCRHIDRTEPAMRSEVRSPKVGGSPNRSVFPDPVKKFPNERI